MPVDEHGNRAEIIMDPNSIINRSNPGALYEQYEGASARDTHKRLCAMLGVPRFMKQYKAEQAIAQLPAEQVAAAASYLSRFYWMISPEHAKLAQVGLDTDPVAYLSEIVEKDIGVYLPPDNELMSEDIVLDLEGRGTPDNPGAYKPTYGRVTYRASNGELTTTENKVMIGPMHFILLEKTGDDWSAVNSGKWQHFGVLSQLTKSDKYSRPARNQAVRVAGEAEKRNIAAYVGPEGIAEVQDRNNNPRTHREMVKRILRDPKPSNISTIINRNEIPFGGSKPLQLLKHLAQVSGFKFTYTPYTPDWLGGGFWVNIANYFSRFKAVLPKWIQRMTNGEFTRNTKNGGK